MFYSTSRRIPSTLYLQLIVREHTALHTPIRAQTQKCPQPTPLKCVSSQSRCLGSRRPFTSVMGQTDRTHRIQDCKTIAR